MENSVQIFDSQHSFFALTSLFAPAVYTRIAEALLGAFGDRRLKSSRKTTLTTVFTIAYGLVPSSLKSPNGLILKAFRSSSSWCSSNIFAVRSAGQGDARRSGRPAVQ